VDGCPVQFFHSGFVSGHAFTSCGKTHVLYQGTTLKSCRKGLKENWALAPADGASPTKCLSAIILSTEGVFPPSRKEIGPKGLRGTWASAPAMAHAAVCLQLHLPGKKKAQGLKPRSSLGLNGTTLQLAEKHLVSHWSSGRVVVKTRHARR
jgi:hypothetical protein